VALIRIQDVHKAFNGQAVLDGVSLEIARGESIVVAGKSGCGKTVLLKHIIGLLRPDRGRVFFRDHEVSSMPERRLPAVRSRFGMLFQGAALFDSMDVLENVVFPLRRLHRLSEDAMAARALEKLDVVGLADARHKMPAELSGGMKKRVALARAIVVEPEVMLYDEPTTGLDPVVADVINELIIRLNRDLNVTGVLVTHDMHCAGRVGSRVVMLDGGRIVADGSLEAMRRSTDATVADFVRPRV
jgi:phospholipid/cholesterol/gamma-HCH transport system ATP-binding protein